MPGGRSLLTWNAMTLALNLIWFVLGGWLAGLLWWLAAILLALTIVGLPWSAAAWRIGSFSFAPFGRAAVYQADLYGRENPMEGVWRILLNILWFALGGWYLALSHIAAAIVFAITIIGLPFAVQHLKLAGLSLFPVGTEIVPWELADESRRVRAAAQLERLRGRRN